MFATTISTLLSKRFARTYCLVFCAMLMLWGCRQSTQNTRILLTDSPSVTVSQKNIISSEGSVARAANAPAANKDIPFAPTTDDKRTHSWQGGVPPMNKQSSEINTYYRLRALEKPQHLHLTLRFEGAKSEDAYVSFKLIDGATFVLASQQTEWRLSPNQISEISFSLIVPDHQSYITLTTFQNNYGAARAFLLETPNSSKTSK